MATYKTKNGMKTGFVPGIGEIIDGQITVPEGVVIESANLVKVTEQPQVSLDAPTTPTTAPAVSPIPSQPAQNTNTNPETK